MVDYWLPHKRFTVLLEKNKIAYVDMTKDMLTNNLKDSPVIFNDGHINAKGHELFAEILYKELLKLNWLSNEKQPVL
jgi:lysophospholipase L1-like esterase